ncbi:37 kDa salivary gland allergen Aed a 2-like [Anopheles gambiae]|uniref:37 kDa salivary gland allergen Aed a 2-like n=1 Tax=Anopheles gambiae TaxID=7165 RepID=UPI002AC8F19B|nr:37 kDa salivary gland allergen Aed a 2-like [Anopheles gambiae]
MQLTPRSVHLVHLLLAATTLISPSWSNHQSQQPAVQALSPDDTLFAHLRCFELFASGQQSRDRGADAADWLGGNRERYLHRVERTPAFVKCVLGWMHFYDSSERRFNVNILRTQYNAYKQWMTLSEEDVDDFIHEVNNMGALNSSNDAEVYDALKLLFTNHSASFFQLFLRDPTVLQNMYDDESLSVRLPNQTVVQFCELQMAAELWDDICLIREYQISNHTEEMERHIACIFRGFQYLDANSSIDVKEIARDYELTGTLHEASKNSIEECARNASESDDIPKRSLAMYSCLLDGSHSEVFKKAFDFREVRSGNLTFLVQNLPYDRDQVRQQILALDKEHCNDQQPLAGRFIED